MMLAVLQHEDFAIKDFRRLTGMYRTEFPAAHDVQTNGTIRDKLLGIWMIT